jgi:hypothetical protein
MDRRHTEHQEETGTRAAQRKPIATHHNDPRLARRRDYFGACSTRAVVYSAYV